MTNLNVSTRRLKLLGALLCLAQSAALAQEKDLAQPPKPAMDSIPDFKCRDITPIPVGLNTTFSWTDRTKNIEVYDAWDATYKAYAVRADTDQQIQEFKMSGLKGPNDKKVHTLHSDPTGMSILGKLSRRTKYSRDVDAATVWFSVTRSHMPFDHNPKYSWIATAFLRIHQNELLEVSPGKEVSRMMFLLACNFLTPAEHAAKEKLDLEQEENDRFEALIRGK